MEQKRRIYANENILQQSKLEKYIERDIEILKGISKLQIPIELRKKKMEELESSIYSKREELEKLKSIQSGIDKGECDTEIQNEIKSNKKVAKEKPVKPVIKLDVKPKQDVKSEIKSDIKKFIYKEEPKLKKSRSENSRENQPPTHSMTGQQREDKSKQRDYDYFYRHFQKCQETLPTYIQENLKEMPNNKGYIWRGCWFFGELENEPNQPLILFEKNRGVMNIHEVDDYEHRIFEKIGKNKKTLVKRIPKHNYNGGRNKKSIGVSKENNKKITRK